MAVTMIGPTIVDDDGSGTYGTIADAAWVADFVARVNTALALLLPLAGGAMTGPITSVLTVTGFGTHSFSAGGTGNQNLMVRNTTAGAGNFASVYLGNDADAAATRLFSFSSSYTTSGQYVQDATVLEGVRAGGMSLAASHASGVIRFYSGGSTLRGQVLANGQLEWGTIAAPGGSVTIVTNQGVKNTLNIGTSVDTAAGKFVVFLNAANTIQGSIQATNSTTTAYVTSSDQRLKIDRGLATDLSALRALRVHDFDWRADGLRDRNIFAQEAYAVSPRGITPGTDGDDVSKPWMAEKAAYVPDLIVGWQQHDAELAALRAEILTLKKER